MRTTSNYVEARFYQTYYFANVVQNLLRNQFEHLRNLDAFYGDELIFGFAQPFPKFSAFHCFIEFAVESILYEDLEKLDLDYLRAEEARFNAKPPIAPNFRKLSINYALEHYDIEHPSFERWLAENNSEFAHATRDDACEYYSTLRDSGEIDALIERTVNEVFFILFGNRELMHVFNDMMARVLSSRTQLEVPVELAELFKRDGVLNRKHIPKWVQRAVYHRDRGTCVLCKKDITGLVNIGNVDNFDHIVALANGGLNDVTNIQLLCADCNGKKSDGDSITSCVYEAWY